MLKKSLRENVFQFRIVSSIPPEIYREAQQSYYFWWLSLNTSFIKRAGTAELHSSLPLPHWELWPSLLTTAWQMAHKIEVLIHTALPDTPLTAAIRSEDAQATAKPQTGAHFALLTFSHRFQTPVSAVGVTQWLPEIQPFTVALGLIRSFTCCCFLYLGDDIPWWLLLKHHMPMQSNLLENILAKRALQRLTPDHNVSRMLQRTARTDSLTSGTKGNWSTCAPHFIWSVIAILFVLKKTVIQGQKALWIST